MGSCESLRHCKPPPVLLWALSSANIGLSGWPAHLHYADSEASISPQRVGLAPTHTALSVPQEWPPEKSARGLHGGLLDLPSHLSPYSMFPKLSGSWSGPHSFCVMKHGALQSVGSLPQVTNHSRGFSSSVNTRVSLPREPSLECYLPCTAACPQSSI